jgi:nicotinamidase-related amidase
MKTIAPLSPGGRARRLIAVLATFLLVVCAVVLAVAASGCGSKTASSPSASAVAQKGFMRGLWDDTFVGVDKAKQDAILSEIADQLHVQVVRLMVFWDQTEPQKGVFNDAYLAPIKQAVEAARAHGLKVILTTYATPEWAQDKSFWKQPPGVEFKANIPYNFYAPRADAIPQYGVFARHIAQYFKGDVFAYECWNEPNLAWFLYPQQVPGDRYFGVDTYLAMLKQYYAGVKANDPQALVLGGNTASAGFDTVQRTSPLTWAEWLKKNDVLKYCDAYSHHPYAVGATVAKPPETMPISRQIVTLADIQELLSIFPKTDFYLTEFGYNSRYSSLFGGGSGVGEVNEAAFLRDSFSLAARYPQIKLLMWYLRVDVKGEASNVFSPAMSTGLRRPDLSLKPAWWAFAGGNTVSEDAPGGKAALGSTFTVTGRVEHSGQPMSGIKLVLQTQVGSSGGAWQEADQAVTDAQGKYSFAFMIQDSTLYYVSWPGVVDGEIRSVTPQ